MPRGQEFSKEFKQLAFSIIDFAENEKSGPAIPLYNVNERLQAMLHISHRSIVRFKQEMKHLKIEEANATGTRRTSSRSSSSSSASISVIPSPPKKYLAGRPKIELSEMEQDTIRLIFHQLLNEKVYPNVSNILNALLSQDPHFPIQFKTALRRRMKMIGFKYKQTTKSKIFLDSTSFQAQRAYYSRKLDELRSANAILYYHDETWLNKNEEKTAIWFDSQLCGRLRIAEGKGKYLFMDKLFSCITKDMQIFPLGQRLAISGLISLNGFHFMSLDIFKCDEVHNMDFEHFSQWIQNTSQTLRSEHGKNPRIVVVIDNATWHNRLTTGSQPPKRSWKSLSWWNG